MSEATPKRILDIASRLAVQAGEMAHAALQSTTGGGAIQRKLDGSVVTETDAALQAVILDAIAAEFPNHAVCAEETLRDASRHGRLGHARYTWVIDPLDGTRNFVGGFPCWSTSIAVLEGGEPVVGVVREHNIGRMYTAVRGGGAYCDGEPMSAAGAGRLGDLLVGFSSGNDRLTVGVVSQWAAIPGLILRNVGSTAVHLAWVAAGSLSAAFAKRVMLWDVAAGALMIREAGGVITTPGGGDYLPFDLSRVMTTELPYLCGGPDVHERLLKTMPEDARPEGCCA